MLYLCTSAYNCSDVIESFINSLWSQTYQDWILLIADDCSSDDTLSRLRYYESKDKRIIVQSNSSNLGLTRSLIKLIALVPNNNFIVRLDTDEAHDCGYLYSLSKLINSGHDIIFVGTSFCATKIFKNLFKLSKTAAAFLLCFYGNIFQHGSISFSKSLYNQSGGYSNFFVLSQDYDLWMKMTLKMNKPYITSSYSFRYSQLQRSSPSLSVKYKSIQLLFSLMASACLLNNYNISPLVSNLLTYLLIFPTCIMIRGLRSFLLLL